MRDFEKRGSEMTPSMSLTPGAELYTDGEDCLSHGYDNTE